MGKAFHRYMVKQTYISSENKPTNYYCGKQKNTNVLLMKYVLMRVREKRRKTLM